MAYYETVVVTKKDGLALITLNRPLKKNAVNAQMFDELTKVLKELAYDDNVTIVAMTGAGEFYCSGNDLSNFSFMWTGDTDGKEAEKLEKQFRQLVTSFIDFPKPLVGLVNGPAIGLAVTLLGLFDLVYASEKATFQTPFSSVGLSPEACSSYTFPKMMGPSRASEMLMFNRKLTAREALERGLVADVFPDNDFRSRTGAKLKEVVELPRETLSAIKIVMRHSDRDVLHKMNDEEIKVLMKRVASDDCRNAAMAFLSRKSKL